MTSYRKLVILVLAVLLVGGLVAVWNAQQKLAQQEAWRKQQAAQKEASKMVGKNASFTVTEGGVKKWRLEAKHAIYTEDNAEATLKTVQGEFFNPEGKPILKFSAPDGKYNSKNNQVVLTGGVLVESLSPNAEQDKPGTLRAPQMTWSAKTDRVTATGGVQLDFPQGKSSAQTCRFTLDFSNIALEGGVSSALTQP